MSKRIKIYKKGICREIDPQRLQEFREKGYKTEYYYEQNPLEDLLEELKSENEQLKKEIQYQLQKQAEELQQETKNQDGGENEQADAPTEGSTKAGKAETTTWAKK